MSNQKVLVIGAAAGSLGEKIAESLTASQFDVTTAGISNTEHHQVEDRYCDLLELRDIVGTIDGVEPAHVICTTGINSPAADAGSIYAGNSEWLRRHFDVNCAGPMNLLAGWRNWLMQGHWTGGHFIAISSNSAHIPRSNSMAYCASKAALSMAIRCAARELKGHPCKVYGYEPGLLRNTPMTQETAARFGSSPTRMKGAPQGLNADSLADQIVAGIAVGGMGLNGVLIPYDAGEQ